MIVMHRDENINTQLPLFDTNQLFFNNKYKSMTKRKKEENPTIKEDAQIAIGMLRMHFSP